MNTRGHTAELVQAPDWPYPTLNSELPVPCLEPSHFHSIADLHSQQCFSAASKNASSPPSFPTSTLDQATVFLWLNDYRYIFLFLLANPLMIFRTKYKSLWSLQGSALTIISPTYSISELLPFLGELLSRPHLLLSSDLSTRYSTCMQCHV